MTDDVDIVESDDVSFAKLVSANTSRICSQWQCVSQSETDGPDEVVSKDTKS